MISVIITTHNRPLEILARAVNSIINSTYNEWELIVVDDSDAIFEERSSIKSYFSNFDDNRITYIQHNYSCGACAARNTGLKASKGDFVGFLDDDDEWVPEKMSTMLAVFETSSPETAMVYCGYYFVYDENGLINIPRNKFQSFKKGYIFKHLIKKNFIGSTSFPLIKTKCLKEIGGFDEQMPASQDYDLWLRLAWYYEVNYIKTPLVYYHIHTNESITKNNEKRILGQERIYNKYKSYLLSHPSARWHRLKQMSVLYALRNDSYNAIKSVKTMFRIEPFFLISNVVQFFKILKHLKKQ